MRRAAFHPDNSLISGTEGVAMPHDSGLLVGYDLFVGHRREAVHYQYHLPYLYRLYVPPYPYGL
ncbi:MAG: hypothetical protein ACQESR_11610 [Planctomycetota bacterium]